jgi:hypothetical protein
LFRYARDDECRGEPGLRAGRVFSVTLADEVSSAGVFGVLE